MADRVAVMYLGRIVELATADDLFRAPRHPYTRALLNAIPPPDPAHRRARPIVQGDVPSPFAPPPGCHFHPRCEYATDRCRTEAPTIETDGAGHEIACHRCATFRLGTRKRARALHLIGGCCACRLGSPGRWRHARSRLPPRRTHR